MFRLKNRFFFKFFIHAHHRALQLVNSYQNFAFAKKTINNEYLGKDADMIVISQDIFANKNTVEKTQVLQTLLAGNEVYR